MSDIDLSKDVGVLNVSGSTPNYTLAKETFPEDLTLGFWYTSILLAHGISQLSGETPAIVVSIAEAYIYDLVSEQPDSYNDLEELLIAYNCLRDMFSGERKMAEYFNEISTNQKTYMGAFRDSSLGMLLTLSDTSNLPMMAIITAYRKQIFTDPLPWDY
jgi:hypothetical protein